LPFASSKENKMKKLTEQECRAFLIEQPWTAAVATVREDGRPHVAVVWFDMDGDDLIFTTWHESVKARNLQHDPRVCLCVDYEEPPFHWVMAEGTAEIIDDPDYTRYWATRIGGRYMGQDKAEEFGRRNGVKGEYVVRVKVTKLAGRRNMTE
jgi:hypothetical protein